MVKLGVHCLQNIYVCAHARGATLFNTMPRKIRILIVEDEAAIRAGLMDVLVYHGYEVDEAADGRVGLDKALSGTFDLILLDIMLPGLDGYDICNRIRASSLPANRRYRSSRASWEPALARCSRSVLC